MELITVFLPLFSALTILFFGRFIGFNGVKIFSILNMILTLLITSFLAYKIILNNTLINLKLFSWFKVGFLSIDWGFLFDNLSVSMLFTVNLVSLLVHFYACYYMKTDPHLIRFLGFLSLFTFFMLFLVTADNFLQLFIGWEGVGLCSYLLINFWFTRIQANKSAMKAVILNRIGDCAYLLAISLILFIFKTLDFLPIFALTTSFLNENFLFFNLNLNYLNIICLFLFIAAMGKSSQIGLHVWLPDAMEGPTPVSALIHAATMVTAGVYLLIRCSILFESNFFLLNLVTLIGALTAFLGASSAVLQNDIKKIIAYSTCSQLGYMFMACGSSEYSIAIFHLINHAFFKALLFLGAGIIIHSLNGEQDMRKMGSLYKILPLTYICMLIASFALTGLPFLSGFYSKEAILSTLYFDNQLYSTFSYWLGLISAILTSFYSVKILFLNFFTNPRGFRIIYLYFHKTSWFALIPIFILSFFSLSSGFYLKDLMIGLGTTFFDGIIFHYSQNSKITDLEFLPFFFKIFPIFISLFGFLFFSLKITLFNNAKVRLTENNKWFFIKKFKFIKFFNYFLLNKWYFDLIYNEFLVNYFFQWSYQIGYKLIDKGIVEVLGVKYSFLISLSLSKIISFIQIGFISFYIRLIFITFLIFQFIYYFI